jgi:DNA-binding XRE family transcriptional regulator
MKGSKQMKTQIIEQNGKPAFVVLSIEDYNALVSDEGFMIQARDNDSGTRYPSDVVDRIIDGQNALKVIREWKNMTQGVLADASGLSKNFISMLETGRRALTDKTARKLANTLGVDVDALIDLN